MKHEDASDSETTALLELHSKRKTNGYYNGSIFVMVFINFLGTIVYSISIPSLYEYVRTLRGDKIFYGWCMSISSIATVVTAPLCGIWANYRPYREVLIVCMWFEIVGYAFYCFATDKWMIFIGRVLIGISGGSMAVGRTYISDCTNPDGRTKAMGYIAIAQVLGFVIGPALAAAVSFVPIINIMFPIQLSPFTWPGYIGAVLGLVNVLLICALLRELPQQLKEKFHRTNTENDIIIRWLHSIKRRILRSTGNESYSQIQSEESAIIRADYSQTRDNSKARIGAKHYTNVAAALCIFAYFAVVTGFSVMEVIATPVTKAFYNWNVTENGILFAGAAVVAVLGFVVLQLLECFISDDRWKLIIGNALMTAGYVALINWGYLPLYQFFIGMFFICVSFPISDTVAMSLYSKVVPESAQGAYMGYLVSASSLASIIGPLWSSYIFENAHSDVGAGASIVFIIGAAIIFASIVSNLIGFRTLVAHPSQCESVYTESSSDRHSDENSPLAAHLSKQQTINS